ncbi:MAG: 3-hydroxyacyl-CoA dehydrogenase [Myxococcales bacterium]|nr:3-hydroxyacyl-CoA dehydrogenase [Myxococcales bacterium]
MQLSGIVGIVSGGASGLGEACVRMITSGGGRAVIVDINTEKGEALAAELGDSARYLRTDVSSEADVSAAVALAKATWGRLDVAISCAGIGTVGKTLSKKGPFPLDLFQKTINVNLVGSANLCRLSAAAMAENTPNAAGERGVLIMTASVAAFDGQIGQLAYAASKGGIVGMTLPMARDLSEYGIRVVTVAPGIFDTPLLAGLPEAARESLAKQVPFPPRLGRPAELAQLARHIIENEMLNGETIRLDGAIRMAPR